MHVGPSQQTEPLLEGSTLELKLVHLHVPIDVRSASLAIIEVLVGLVTWAALLWIALERAAVWGAAAALLNLVPYLGSIVNAGGLALVGFLQFDTIGMAILVGGVSLFINTLEGNLLTPWLTSRASRLNPVVVFVGVLTWGWLLGIWGLFLGVPLLMVTKAVCDRIDDLKPIGELLDT